MYKIRTVEPDSKTFLHHHLSYHLIHTNDTEDDSDENNGNQPNHQLLQILNKKTAHQGGVGKCVGEFEMLRSTFDGLR